MQKSNIRIKKITLGAMLVAMSVVIGIFCKSALNFADGMFRVTFENLPIILSGVTLGPIFGGVVGLLSDLISYLLSGQAYPINPIVTIGSAVVGIVSGIVARYLVRKRGVGQLLISGVSAHLFGSVVIKSIGLFTFYQWMVLVRIPLYLLLIAPIEILVLCLLYKKTSFKRLIDEIDKDFNKRGKDK